MHSLETGLPSLSLSSIALDGKKLWVAYGGQDEESGLGLYDPNNEQWQTVFCSTLKGNNPFSEGQTYQINSLTKINSKKMFFNVSGIEQSGVWIMDTETKGLRNLTPSIGEIEKDEKNNLYLKSLDYWIKVNPDTEKMTVIMREPLERFTMAPKSRRSESGLNEDIFLPESFLRKITFNYYWAYGSLDLSTGTIHKNKLWARLGKSQIIIAEKGKSFEDAQIIDNNILDGGVVLKFVSTPYGLVGIGEGIVGLIEDKDLGN